MKTEEIQTRINRIMEISGDDERAHAAEDELMRHFIAYVSTLDNPLAEKAKLVLQTNEINFQRWCA